MTLHWPLLKALISSILPYSLMVLGEWNLETQFASSASKFIFWFILGYFYTNIFEWWYHNYWLHKWRTSLRVGHAYHHAKLHGEHFRTRDRERLEATTTSWYIFPVLLTLHNIMFTAIFGHENVIAFFSGITFHFTICYEIAHWLTHVKDNAVDKFIEKTKILNKIRAKQIEHHQLHHAEYNINFNFSPPYAGDQIFKTKK